MEDVRIEWEAPAFVGRTRSADWYWGVGLVAVAGAFISILFNNVILAILILVAAGAFVIQSMKKPHAAKFAVDKRGVQIDDLIYTFDTLESFWIDEDRLLVQSKKKVTSLLSIPMDSGKSDEIYNTMLEHLPEEQLEESFGDYIARGLGF